MRWTTIIPMKDGQLRITVLRSRMPVEMDPKTYFPLLDYAYVYPRTIAMNKGLDFGIAESGSFQVLCAAVTIWFWMQERRIVVTVAQPNSAPYDHEWRFYVAAVAFLVGLCIGALQLLAGLAGVVGSGTGIMLAVTIIYSSLEGRGRTGAFGL
ncbi:hypothetical protein U9M48_041051 [Paspalum notatum var. saurae]|uniref:Uncharacterized protein n=1 Tax=Paspalum notatum var. saurae TaxID=547442 RepID=A0AAQ3XEU8_PASNO